MNETDSNILVIEADKPCEKISPPVQILKPFKKVPIEEIELSEINTEPRNFVKRIKSLFNYLDKLDKKISRPLQYYTPNFAVEIIFFIFAKLFNTEPVITYLIFILIYSIKFNSINIFLVTFLNVSLGGCSTALLKKIFRRSRPTLSVKRYFKSVRIKEKTNSMPSGDSLQAGIFTTMIILYLNWNYKFFVYLLIPASMSGRVYYNCHYWFDCIIGAILGIIIAFGSDFILNRVKLYNNF